MSGALRECFGDFAGIYVWDEGFREMIDSGRVYSYDSMYGGVEQQEINRFNSGSLFELLCTVKVLESNQELIMSTNFEMRVRRHGSRHSTQKVWLVCSREDNGKIGK